MNNRLIFITLFMGSILQGSTPPPSFKFNEGKLLRRALSDDKEYFKKILKDEDTVRALNKYLEDRCNVSGNYIPSVVLAMKLIGGATLACGMSLIGFGAWNYNQSDDYISHKIHLATEIVGGLITLWVGYRCITTTKEDVEASLSPEEQKIRLIQKYVAECSKATSINI